MKISQKRLVSILTFLVLLLIGIESSIDAFQIENLFSVLYGLPILLCMFLLQYSLKKEHSHIISIIAYLVILLVTIQSLLHLLVLGFLDTDIPAIEIFAVFLNVLMMSFAILQFRTHTKWQKSLSEKS